MSFFFLSADYLLLRLHIHYKYTIVNLLVGVDIQVFSTPTPGLVQQLQVRTSKDSDLPCMGDACMLAFQ